MRFEISGRHARRAALKFLPITALVLLGACTVTTNSNGTATVTVNVAEIDAYGKVGISAVATILSVAAVASALGATGVSLVNAAAAALSAALASFDNDVSGTLTFMLDDSSALGLAKSVITALANLLVDLKSAASALAGKIGSDDLANVNTAISGAETALALAEALLGFVGAANDNARVRMTRPQMFRAVGLPVPAWAA